MKRLRKFLRRLSLLNRAWDHITWDDDGQRKPAPRWAQWRVGLYLRAIDWKERHGKELACGCSRFLGFKFLYAADCEKHFRSKLNLGSK